MPDNGIRPYRRRWIAIFGLVALGIVIGAGGIIASIEINRVTATDAVCTSCHTMATVAADPQYRESRHRTNAAGVLAGCGDCHIPTNNWFVETYSHIFYGVKDVIAESTGKFSDPAVWDARRIELTKIARDIIRRNHGVSCRKCHVVSAIHAANDAHAALEKEQATCVDCHAIHARPAAAPKP